MATVFTIERRRFILRLRDRNVVTNMSNQNRALPVFSAGLVKCRRKLTPGEERLLYAKYFC